MKQNMKYNLLVIAAGLVIFFAGCTTSSTHVAVDVNKCNLDYIRQLVFESCIRPHKMKNRHRKRHAMFLHELEDDPMESFPFELMPPNHTMIVVRRKRSTDSVFLKYFHYCCEFMDECENMPCD